MTGTTQRPDTAAVLRGLKDFQRQTLDYAFDRLYNAPDSTCRFLVADEVGLGKTLVARGIIAKAVERLWDTVDKIDVVYICSNTDIARQNVRRLNITNEKDFAIAARMTLLPTLLEQIQRQKLNFISFTPATSFQLKQATGWREERILLYWLLKQAWGVSGTGPLNLLQGRVTQTDRFRAEVNSYPHRVKIDKDLTQTFVEALGIHVRKARDAGEEDLRARFQSLCTTFGRARDYARIPSEDRIAQSRLIGDLRAVLAATCIRALEPDLVILDEFQRFKDLLGGEDDASRLAKELFDYEGKDGKARILLLSATPYKMFTIRDGATDQGDHYADFLQTLRFLQNDPAATGRVRDTLDQYRRAMLRLATDGSATIVKLKEVLEYELRRVIARTERLACSEDRNGMLVEVPAAGVRLEARDVNSYQGIQTVARAVEQPDTIEYWKAAPYLLNFMQEYKLNDAVISKVDEEAPGGPLARQLARADRPLLLPRPVLEGREAVDPPHPRLRWLLADTVDRGLWKLLWLPPSLPYYRLAGPFDDPELQRATKRLVFSSWRVVPRAVAAMVSHEAERRMLGSAINGRTMSEVRDKASPTLRFTRADGRLTGMPVLALLYPSIFLARTVAPLGATAGLSVDASLPSLAAVLRSAREILSDALQALPDGAADGPVDESWYWAAPVLLDLHFEPDAARRWLQRADLSTRWSGAEEGVQSEDAQDQTGWALHVAELVRVAGGGNTRLGRRPDDLLEVLALQAIAGPAVAALRTLGQLYGNANAFRNDAVRDAAAHIAWGLRNLFNLPEVTALIRGLNGDEPYWRRVLEYSAGGCLQAVLDEYAHVLPESLGHVDTPRPKVLRAVANEMRQALGVRAAQIGVRTFDFSAKADAEIQGTTRMRARFAARFGDQEDEEAAQGGVRLADRGKTATRTTQLRSAFNSPFWPFVLVTTSVGQEGLDFHQFCHAVVHWNLPSNPVDLEQREGRVHRYKGHAVRRNLAARFGPEALRSGVADPWTWAFRQACAERPAGTSDVVPYWVYPVDGGARIERHVPTLPLSRDVEQLSALRRTLAVYRMVFGQPRQDELLDYLIRQMPRDAAMNYMDALRIDLGPRGL